MPSQSCDGCHQRMTVAGGSPNVWDFSESERRRSGMILEFADGTSHRLCFSCIEALPEEPTADDVAALAAER